MGAHERLLEIFQELFGKENKEYRQKIQMHSYCSDLEFAKKLMALPGCEIFFSFYIANDEAKNLELIKNLPENQIIVETDGPHGGKRPFMLNAMLGKIVENFEGREDIVQTILENTKRFVHIA